MEKLLKRRKFKRPVSSPVQLKRITFGDMNDPKSDLTKEFKSQRSYGLLEELNTKPAVRYKSKIRNSQKIKGQKKGH